MAIDLANYKVPNAPGTVFYIPNFISEEEEQLLLSKVYSAPRTKWTVLSHRRLQNWGGLPGPKGMVAEDLPQWLSRYANKISNLGAFEGNVPNHVLVNEYESGQGIMPHEDGPAFYPTVSTISLGSHTVLDFYYHLNADVGDNKQGQSEVPVVSGSLGAASAVENNSSAVETAEGKSTAGLHASTQCSQKSGKYTEGSCCSPASKSQDGDQATCGAQQEGVDTLFDSRHFLSLLLQRRSLVLLQDDMYKVHLHGIKEVKHDAITGKIANLDTVPEVKVGDVLERQTRVSLTIRYVPKVLKSKLIFGKR